MPKFELTDKELAETTEITATPLQHYAMTEELIHQYGLNPSRYPHALQQALIHATLATVQLPIQTDDDEDLRP